MAGWITLQNDPLYTQPHQQAFLGAIRERWCQPCKAVYQTTPPTISCPTCGVVGSRVYDRLTIIAGRRFGKTRIGSVAAVEQATVPNTIGWAAAPTNPKLHRYVIPAFQKLIPQDWVQSWSSEFNDLRLKNGSLIHFQTLEHPDQGRGQGLDWLWIDEVCELSKTHWEVIRPSLIDKQGLAFFTSSPRSYDWVYDELFKPAHDRVPGYWAAQAKTADNPAISNADLDRERAVMSDTMFRQEYEAEFVTFTGAVYGDLVSAQILHTPAEIRKVLPEYPHVNPDRETYVGLDTGADHPFGAVKVVSTEKGLVVVADYLERHRSFYEHAEAIKRLASPNPARYAINKNERQPMIELARHGMICQGAENNQMAGIERVKTWLHHKELWFVEPWCPRTIRQMQALRYAEPRRDGQSRDTVQVYKRNDELPDCLRYVLMTFPRLPKPVEASTERDLSELPPESRWAVERMRRVDKRDRQVDAPIVVGDFWA